MSDRNDSLFPIAGADRRTIVFMGSWNKRPGKDSLLDAVFRFSGVEPGSGNVAFFTSVGGDFPGFLELLDYDSEAYSRAVILFKEGDAFPGQEALLGIPIPWEAFRVFPDGRFSKVLEEVCSPESDPERRDLLQEMEDILS